MWFLMVGLSILFWYDLGCCKNSLVFGMEIIFILIFCFFNLVWVFIEIFIFEFVVIIILFELFILDGDII